MRFLRLLNWSMRKLRLPIGRDDLVIEVGSGGNPHPKSHILAEKFVDSSHRLKAIRIDRELVLADACCMPFKDKVFDYSIAFHVLEHVPDPAAFLGEMMRISRAGYIETPNAIYERFRPLDVHLLELMDANGELLIFKKPSARQDEILDRGNPLDHDRAWKRLFDNYPEMFHVCHRWRDRISFRVINDTQSLDWHQFPTSGLAGAALPPHAGSEASDGGLRGKIIGLVRWYWRQVSRVRVDIDRILCCPKCRGELQRRAEHYACPACDVAYSAVPHRDFTHAIPLTDCRQ